MQNKKILLILVGSLIALKPFSLLADSWSFETALSSKDFSLSALSTAIDSNGKIHVAYGGKRLFHAVYDSGSWQTVTVDSTVGVGNNAAIALDSSGYVHISYEDENNLSIKYATNSSGSWTTETAATCFSDDPSDSSLCKQSALAVDSSGTVHLVYYGGTESKEKEGTDDYTPDTHWFYMTKSSGSSWSSTITVVDSGGLFRLGIDSTNTPHVLYQSITGPVWSTLSGGSWSSATTIDSSISEISSLSLFIDGSNVIHAAYIDDNTENLKHAYRRRSRWIAKTVDSNGTSAGYNPIYVDSSSALHIAYRDSSTNDIKYAIKSRGGKWSSSTATTADNNNGRGIVVNSSGTPFILYEEDSYLKCVSKGDGSWTVTTVDQNIGGKNSIAIATDSSQQPLIAFRNNITAGALAYLSKSGGVWTPSTITTDSTADTGLNLLVDTSGFFQVLMIGEGSHKLHHWTNSSGSWASSTVASVGSPDSMDGNQMSSTYDSTGKLHVMYGTDDNEVMHAFWDSGTWQTETVAKDMAEGIDLAIDSSDQLHVSYINKSEKLVYALKTTNGWSVETIITDTEYENTAIVVGTDNVVHIFFPEESDSEGIDHAYGSIGSWTIEQIDQDSTYGITAVTDSAGHLHVLYTKYNSGIHYATNSGGSWQTTEIATNEDRSFHPAMTIDSSDKLHIAYGDNESGDITYGTLQLSPSSSSGSTSGSGGSTSGESSGSSGTETEGGKTSSASDGSSGGGCSLQMRKVYD